MSKFKVLLTDYAWPDVRIEREVLATVDAELIVAESTEPSHLAQLAAGVDAIMACWAPTTAEVIAAATNCRIVARMGIGLDNIDVDYCTSNGIPVTNVPDYCVVEVAEHTLGLIFSLARKTAFYHHATKLGRYDALEGGSSRRIEGLTLGVVGLGRIGSLVAHKAQLLGMQVIGSRRRAPSEQDEVPTCALDELLAASDIVSLHLPLNDETWQLMSADRLAAMRPESLLINTSRGGLVDHAALAEALMTGPLAGAALDVQEPEPPPLDQPPFNDPRVIVTPHTGFVSEDSVLELRRRAAEQVATALRGEVPENVVNDLRG